ncbi:MAG: type II secretion system protein [Burkholderiales bacterium]
MTKKLQLSRGFTLIELAVVIVVIALLLGALLVPLGTQVEQRKVAETQKALEEIREALLGFAMANGRLPKPSGVPSGSPPSINLANPAHRPDGRERPAACGANDCFGFLPWADLGMPSADAWNKLYRYSVTETFTVPPAALTTPGNRLIRTRNTPGMALADLATGVVAVVLSHGPSNYGVTPGFSVFPNLSSPNNPDEERNYNYANSWPALAADRYFVTRVKSTSTNVAVGGDFDDLLVWIPQSLFMHRMVAAGRLP